MGCVQTKQKSADDKPQAKAKGTDQPVPQMASADAVNSAWNDNNEPIVEQKVKPAIANVKLKKAELDTIGVTRVFAGLKDTKISAEETYFEFFDCFSETLWQQIKIGLSCNTNESDSTDKYLIEFARRGHCNVGKLMQNHNADEPGLTKFAWSEQRKCSSTIIENAVELEGRKGYNKRLLIQGDPHTIKDACETYLGPNGVVRQMTDENKGRIGIMIDRYA